MIKTLTPRNTISDMYNTLMSEGVFKIDHYITGDELQQLHDEVQEKCENEGGHYEFGRNYRGPSLNHFDSNSAMFKVYDAHWMRSLHREMVAQYSNSGEYGKNIFATHDYKFTGELARNGWLHFDRNWCLKFFIYLTDIDKSSGAFSCSPKSRQRGEVLRNEAQKRSENYNDVKNRIELDYPELLETYPPEPIEAKAGTLIVFDTHTFHKGGQVEKGKERLVVRLHCG
jgi:hypothetical protein